MSNALIIYILGGIIVILLVWMVLMERRLRQFWRGSNAQSLEGLMANIAKEVEALKKVQIDINKHLVTADKRLDKSIRAIETVRFNPFEGSGGNQSFAISFLNDEGDGVILSSIYARDRMSIFAKPIAKGVSEFELSAEEKNVLKKSK